MTCLAAVSISKARIAGDLAGLLTPEQAAALLAAYAAENRLPIESSVASGGVYARLGPYQVTMRAGRVLVSSDSAGGSEIDAVAAALAALLEAGGARLLDGRIALALAGLGALEQATVAVDNPATGTTQTATRFTLTL